MRYMGGKHRQSRTIARHVQEVLTDWDWYVEPFCGAMEVAARVAHNQMLLADSSQALMTMWRFFYDNPHYRLPENVSETDYNFLKKVKDPGDWRTAYVGFGMSFGGKWFGGYARDSLNKRDYAGELRRAMNRKRAALVKEQNRLKLVCSSYDKLDIPPNSVIYLDPPYLDRTKPHDCGGFDHGKYWDWVRMLAATGHIVLATEYTFPSDFTVLHDFGDTVVRHYKGGSEDLGISECLVCHESQAHFWGVVR